MTYHKIEFYQQKTIKSIRALIWCFIIGLVLSGLTALGVETQMFFLSVFFPSHQTFAGQWFWKVYEALKEINIRYPFIAYGFDWLAFAHLVIAVAFIGPLQDPVRNKWVIQFGRIACIMVFPLAFIMGPLREIPVWWRLIDCSFGLIALLPLSKCYSLINRLERLQLQEIKVHETSPNT